MYYYLILALQAFCIYHLFKYKNDYYWVFIIVFIPVIGSLIYLITQVYNKRDAQQIQNEIVTLMNPTKKVTDLKKKLEFSDTFQNRVDLADAYMEMLDYQNAVVCYENSLKDNFQNDVYVIKQLIKANSELENYKDVIRYAERIKDTSEFKKTHYQFLYALALEHLERMDEAEENLSQIDRSFSNYEERLYFVKFLRRLHKDEEAGEILNELHSEFSHMRQENKRKYKHVFLEVQQLLG